MNNNNFILKIRKFVLIYTKAKKKKNIFSFIFVLEKPKFHMQRTDLKIELTRNSEVNNYFFLIYYNEKKLKISFIFTINLRGFYDHTLEITYYLILKLSNVTI